MWTDSRLLSDIPSPSHCIFAVRQAFPEASLSCLVSLCQWRSSRTHLRLPFCDSCASICSYLGIFFYNFFVVFWIKAGSYWVCVKKGGDIWYCLRQLWCVSMWVSSVWKEMLLCCLGYSWQFWLSFCQQRLDFDRHDQSHVWQFEVFFPGQCRC